MNLTFVVHGDPVPYLRMTQGQVKLMRIPDRKISASGAKVKAKIQRYFDWKEFVSAHTLGLHFDRAPKKKLFLNVMCYFADKKHADPENIRKGIQDAIFEQDKMVAGAVDFDYDKDNPRCEITISDTLEINGNG
jgi:hypothetical protein